MEKSFSNPYDEKILRSTFEFMLQSKSLKDDLIDNEPLKIYAFVEQFINSVKYWDAPFTTREKVLELLKKMYDGKAYPWMFGDEKGYLLYFSKPNDTLSVCALSVEGVREMRFKDIFNQLSKEEKQRIAKFEGNHLLWETELTSAQKEELLQLV